MRVGGPEKMIRNFTPHEVNIIRTCTFSPEIRKYVAPEGTTPDTTIPSEGMLNAKIDTVPGPEIDGIPTFTKKIVGCDPLPELGPDDFVIVSALYASALRATGGDTCKLLLVADPVMSPDGKTFLGCRGLAPIF
jgi:hypothetical protein